MLSTLRMSNSRSRSTRDGAFRRWRLGHQVQCITRPVREPTHVEQRRGVVVKPGKRQAKAPRTASPLTSLITAPRRTAGAQLKLPGRRGRKPKNVTGFRRCAAMHFGDFTTSARP